MKIKIVHRLCDREVLVQQILDTQGHCPWDGKAFNKDYTAVLTGVLHTAEVAGSVLEDALEKIAGMEPELTIDPESVLGLLRNHIESLNEERRPVRR